VSVDKTRLFNTVVTEWRFLYSKFVIYITLTVNSSETESLENIRITLRGIVKHVSRDIISVSEIYGQNL
jgi:hypothetical protein